MEVIKPGVYVHFKGGRYNVLGTAVHRDSGRVDVIYHKLYSEDRSWESKPLSEFTETITRGDYTGPRYRLEWANTDGPK